MSTGLTAVSTTPEAVEAFLLSRQVMGCTPATLAFYRETLLGRFTAALPTLGDCTPLAVQGYLSALRNGRRAPVTVHKHFRALRAFCSWAHEAGLFPQSPMQGLAMKAPRTLPNVPEDETVRRLLLACPDTWEGHRNRALIALVADSGLRISEALRLRIEDLNPGARGLVVHAGKGQKDGLGFFGAEVTQLLRRWLQKRPDAHPEDFLFVDRQGRSLTRRHATHVLHKLSDKAGLPRRVGPHALRHYAATSILRQTGDLELVRQVLRHESLAMAPVRSPHEARREREVQAGLAAGQPEGRKVKRSYPLWRRWRCTARRVSRFREKDGPRGGHASCRFSWMSIAIFPA